MLFASQFQEVLRETNTNGLQTFGDLLDEQWIAQALAESGKASVRRRKIPADVVVWLVIGMALFRDRSIQEVLAHLSLVLPSQNGKETTRAVAASAIPQARERLGAAPLKAIFERSGAKWSASAAAEDKWRGLEVYGLDGTTLRVADTEENRSRFCLPGSSRGQSGYPQVRLVTVMALRSHIIRSAAFGPCCGKATGELSLARKVWSDVPDDSLMILDKGFSSYGDLFRLCHDEAGTRTGKHHWLLPAKKNAKWKKLKTLGAGDELVEVEIHRDARQKDERLPKTMTMRLVSYSVDGDPPKLLFTSLLDESLYPASEIAELYHERWELEIAYDEVKTHMLERQEALRSKKPGGVEQEVWGILLTYNLVRKKMIDAAQDLEQKPLRISFRHTLQLLRVFCIVEAWNAPPGKLAKRLLGLEEMIALLVIPPRRNRKYPRHVKIKMSSYKRNPGKPEPRT